MQGVDGHEQLPIVVIFLECAIIITYWQTRNLHCKRLKVQRNEPNAKSKYLRPPTSYDRFMEVTSSTLRQTSPSWTTSTVGHVMILFTLSPSREQIGEHSLILDVASKWK